MKQITKYLVGLHLLLLLGMTLCRIVLLTANPPSGPIEWNLLGHAFLIGLKFDNLIASYIILLPLVLTLVTHIIFCTRENYTKIIRSCLQFTKGWYLLFGVLVICIEICNTRYYQFFNNHLNIGVTEWFGFAKETTGMLIQDSGNWLFCFIGIFLAVVYCWAVIRWSRTQEPILFNVGKEIINGWQTWLKKAMTSILLLGICFCGLRSSFQSYPLAISFAYFCSNNYYNKLGINPIFNIIKSADYQSDTQPKLLAETDSKIAEANISNEKNLKSKKNILIKEPTNVVIVLMESMNVQHLDEQINGKPQLPFLSDLRNHSVYFSNFFSAGIHTNNGLTATLFGLTPDFQKATMTVPSHCYQGLPSLLTNEGYQSYAFVTSTPHYDNMNSCFYGNGFKRVYSIYDYPNQECVNTFGVSDRYLLQNGIKVLDQLSSQNEKPFFSLFLTVSNHIPYVIPDEFKSSDLTEQQQMLCYVDHTLEQFIQTAKETEWGKHTLFVLVGDHGSPGETTFDYNLQYNQIPMFLIHPQLKDTIITEVGLQNDICATVMGLLGFSFENKTMGIDLLQQHREYAYFVNDNHLGCSDGEWLYSYNIQTGIEDLYRIGESGEHKAKNIERFQEMRQYALQHQLINLQLLNQPSE